MGDHFGFFSLTMLFFWYGSCAAGRRVRLLGAWTASAAAGAGAPTASTDAAADVLTAADFLDFVLVPFGNAEEVVKHGSVNFARVSEEFARETSTGSRDDIAVGTAVWAISHPKGARAYFSQGFITSWDSSKPHFKHNIPMCSGSSGAAVRVQSGAIVGIHFAGNLAFRAPLVLQAVDVALRSEGLES
jgi:hypothetical protein